MASLKRSISGRSQFRNYDAPTIEPRATTVQGKSASSYEVNVAQALDTVGLEYLFQMSFWGGRRLRGGLILDFLVFTRPLPTPLWVNGGIWHSGKQAEEDRLQQLTLYWYANGALARSVILWDDDCNTPEAALNAVRREFL